MAHGPLGIYKLRKEKLKSKEKKSWKELGVNNTTPV